MFIYVVFSLVAFVLYAIFLLHIYYKYKKFKKLYGVVNFNTFIQSYFSFLKISSLKSYSKKEDMLDSTGWNLKVETFYFSKFTLALFLTIFFSLVTSTNLDLKYGQIVPDVNFKRTLIEEKLDKNDATLKELEKDNFKKLKNQFQRKRIYSVPSTVAINEIESVIIDNNMLIPGDQSSIQSRRMYEKLMILYAAEDNARSPLAILLVFFLSFVILDFVAWVKRKFIYDTADWEIIRLASTAKIFASLPPYSLGSITSNMLRDSNIFKKTIQDFDNLIQPTSSEDDIIKFFGDIKNDDLFRLLDLVYSAKTYGAQTIAPSLERFRENKIESVEIKNQRRDGIKAVYALIPVIAVGVLAMLYLSYGSFYLASSIFQ